MSQGSSSGGLRKESRNYCCGIVDDHQLFAESLKLVLERKFRCFNCLIARNGREALQLVTRNHLEFLLVDIHLPDMNGVELTRQLLQHDPSLRVVILTMDSSPDTVFQAITSGACGYLLKTSDLNRLYRDLTAILEGDVVIGVEVASLLFKRLRDVSKPRASSHSPLLERLSPRELEVLQRVVQGKDNRTIAQELFISEKTVKNHVAHILEKLEVSNRLQLVLFTLREGLLEESPGSEGLSWVF